MHRVYRFTYRYRNIAKCSTVLQFFFFLPRILQDDILKALLSTVLGLDEGNQRLVIRAVVLIRDERGVVHGRSGFLTKSRRKETKERDIGQRINVA